MNNNDNNDILFDLHNYSASLKNREIFLHNHFVADDGNPGVEYRMANTFIKNLNALDRQNHNHILIHMQSVGGEWSDGMAIYDAITNCQSYITILVYGQAESMSSIILQAADTRIMMPNAYFMSHYGSTDAGGEYLSVQNWVAYEKHICQTMLDIYANQCVNGKFFKDKYGDKLSNTKVKNFLNTKLKQGDWYINAEDTINYGFADGVLGDRKYPNMKSIKDISS
jgi:ATP-dependent protease ClpP protease subunit